MTKIILALITLLSSCGWIVSGRKYRQEVRKSSAEAEQEELNLSVNYVKEFQENIYEPLREEVHKLRTAIEAVGTCPRRDSCPVLDRLCDSTAETEPRDGRNRPS